MFGTELKKKTMFQCFYRIPVILISVLEVDIYTDNWYSMYKHIHTEFNVNHRHLMLVYEVITIKM